MRVIISGATSMLGVALIEECVAHGIEVVALVRRNSSKTTVLPSSPFVTVIEADLNDLKSIAYEKSCDVFYHFAWAGSAGAARADTKLQLQNAQWTIDCLRAAKEVGCKKFVAAGSIMEHESMAAAFAAGNKPGLGYIYGSGKLVAHTMAMSVAADIGIDLVWAEITNAYGVGELSPRMVNTTIRKVIKGEEPQFTAGTQNYDFVYIDDVAKAFYLIGKNGKPFNEYLIGSSNAKPLKEFLLEMKAAIAPDLNFIFGDIPFTGINLPLEKYDCSKTEKDTSFKAQISFGEGCRRTMEWLKQVEVNK